MQDIIPICLSVTNVLKVDDMTGTIDCVAWHKQQKAVVTLSMLGRLVRVRGRVGFFRQQRQITIYDICRNAI
jgi:DNA/RNA endonuclease YhcR with UshA esterase domain